MCAVSVRLSVMWLNSASMCGGHSVQHLPNHFGLLLTGLQRNAPTAHCQTAVHSAETCIQ